MASFDGSGTLGRPLTKTEFAYQVLRQKILEGEFRAGDRLPLRGLADEFGLSVMPVREAITALEREGLVRTESHRGAIVAPIAAETVVSIIGVRMWLEVLCVREATLRHDAASLALVHERLEAAERSVRGDALAFARANRALHEAIDAPADPEVLTIMRELWDRSWQARRGSSVYGLVPDVREEAQREHRDIVRALDERDPDAAAAAMLVHRESTLATWRTALHHDTAAPVT
jgi:DNA-binding GntR family transcriptional regulator